MKKLNLKFVSVTYALKAKDILNEQGIKSYVKKNPNPKKGEGCGYYLLIPKAPDNTANMLKIRGLDFTEATWDK